MDRRGPEDERNQSTPVYVGEKTYSLSRDSLDVNALQIALRLSGA
jgi:hypothetical protein